MDIVVNGINLMALVFGLVEFSKKTGLKGKALTMLSMGIGVLVGIAYQIAKMYPAVMQWFGVAVFGLAVGLAASGVYSFADARWPKQKADDEGK